MAIKRCQILIETLHMEGFMVNVNMKLAINTSGRPISLEIMIYKYFYKIPMTYGSLSTPTLSTVLFYNCRRLHKNSTRSIDNKNCGDINQCKPWVMMYLLTFLLFFHS